MALMPLRVYKPGQGVRARVVALVGAGLAAFFAAQWLHGELIESRPGWSYGVPVGVGVVVMGAALWLVNWPRLVDLLIETEAELGKVSWSSRGDLWKSTWVVIFSIIFMATFMFVVVKVLEPIFRRINVLIPAEKPSVESTRVEWPWPARPLAKGPTPPAPPPAGDVSFGGPGRRADAATVAGPGEGVGRIPRCL
jgi:preprotein translocase subunit SecE